MAVSDSFLDYVIEQLEPLGGVRARRMFGAVGLYSGDVFFGIVARNLVYFRVDDVTRADFLARGMGPFQPFIDRPEVTMAYYQLPADVLEDAETMLGWARKAVRAAASAPRKTSAPRQAGSRRRKATRKRGGRAPQS